MSDLDIYAAMQEGKEPIARYKKTIVGKVHIVALNPFSENPEGVLLEGDGENSFVEFWNSKQLVFFERMNRSHIEAGRLVKMDKAPEPFEVTPNQLSDEEIDKLLNEKFMSLKSRVSKFTDTAPLLRLINRARELEKSEKIIKYLEESMAKLELEKYG